MHFYNQKLGAGFPLPLQLPSDTTPNVDYQRFYAEPQADWNKFKEFYVNCTPSSKKEYSYQCYFVSEARKCLLDNLPLVKFNVTHECGANLKVPLATTTEKGESINIL